MLYIRSGIKHKPNRVIFRDLIFNIYQFVYSKLVYFEYEANYTHSNCYLHFHANCQ